MANPMHRIQAIRKISVGFFIFSMTLISIVVNYFFFKYRFKCDIVVYLVVLFASGVQILYNFSTLDAS